MKWTRMYLLGYIILIIGVLAALRSRSGREHGGKMSKILRAIATGWGAKKLGSGIFQQSFSLSFYGGSWGILASLNKLNFSEYVSSTVPVR